MVQAESEARSESQPSFQGPPTHPASVQWVIWMPSGQMGGCVLQGHRALSGRPLARPRPCGSDPCPHLYDLRAVAVCPGHCLQDLPLPYGWPEEPESQLGPGRPAPSVMKAG